MRPLVHFIVVATRKDQSRRFSIYFGIRYWIARAHAHFASVFHGSRDSRRACSSTVRCESDPDGHSKVRKASSDLRSRLCEPRRQSAASILRVKLNVIRRLSLIWRLRRETSAAGTAGFFRRRLTAGLWLPQPHYCGDSTAVAGASWNCPHAHCKPANYGIGEP